MQVIIALVLITVINIIVTQGRVWHTTARDTRRLQLALRAEIGELATLIQANLDRLRSGAPYLLSLRACTFFYRGNVQRLGLVPDSAIGSLVGAYAIVEQAEHLIAATTKPYGQLAFRVIVDETPVDEILRELERARAAVRTVLAWRPEKRAAAATLAGEAVSVADPLLADRVGRQT